MDEAKQKDFQERVSRAQETDEYKALEESYQKVVQSWDMFNEVAREVFRSHPPNANTVSAIQFEAKGAEFSFWLGKMLNESQQQFIFRKVGEMGAAEQGATQTTIPFSGPEATSDD